MYNSQIIIMKLELTTLFPDTCDQYQLGVINIVI